MSSINELCDFLRETAFAIHRYHKHGHLEKVYENALAHRLKKTGLNVQQQYPLNVFEEDGTPIGEYFADLIVEDTLDFRFSFFCAFCAFLRLFKSS